MWSDEIHINKFCKKYIDFNGKNTKTLKIFFKGDYKNGKQRT